MNNGTNTEHNQCACIFQSINMQTDYQISSLLKIKIILLLSFLIVLDLNVPGVRTQNLPNGELTKKNLDETIWPNNYFGSCVNVDCSITCKNGDSKYLLQDINASKNVQSCQRTQIFLTISNYTFESNEIQENWYPTSLEISELEIESSDISVIQPYAFANDRFANLTNLVLENLSLNTLDSNVFRGLDNLKQLVIIQDKSAIATISSDVLIPMQFKIKTLKIRANLTTSQNITCGLALLSALTYVDLSRNNFRDTISRRAFFKLSIVETLDLSYSNIMSLPSDVFYGISTSLRFVDLSHNWLTTLPPFIFQPISTSYKVTVDLSKNNWNCSCGLQKVVRDLKNSPPATCSAPPQFLMKQIVRVDLCDSEKSPSVEVNRTDSRPMDPDDVATGNPFESIEDMSHSTTLASSHQNQVIKVLCQICEEPDCMGDQLSYYERLRVRGREEDIRITLLTSTSVRVAVAVTEGSDYGLIWFSNATKFYYQMEINYKEYGLGCYGSMAKPVIVDNLVPNMTYTFCIVHHGEEVTSPFNCVSHHVSVINVRSQDVWLSEDSKSAVISLLICGNVIAMLIGGCLVYCAVMRKPTLLWGSKRVVVVKKNSADVIVLPRMDSIIRERMEGSSIKKKRPSMIRQKSSTSLDSYVSPNLYETIPAEKIKKVEESNNFYLSKPVGQKRLSSDPLPLTPQDQTYLGSRCHNCLYIDNNDLSNYL